MAPTFPQRHIGDTPVSALGLGCMGMSIPGGPSGTKPSEADSLATLTAAADAGVTFWDTSDFYGPHHNEELIGRWFKENPERRKEIFLATKFGCRFVGEMKDMRIEVSGSKDYVRQACEASLKRLGVDCIDLYYAHRIDSTVPIEETVGAMAELVKEGKVKYLGLSECSARTIRRACKVHPIAAAQLEFSPFALDIEDEKVGVLKACREEGVKVVVYSPLGRGFLTGTIRKREDMDPSDLRFRMHPRFSEENFPGNLKLVEGLEVMAKEKGCTPGQLALAWVMAQGEGEIPVQKAILLR
jgi:aryl-alcohol dehydrogenase-like predicted oxidoreductase